MKLRQRLENLPVGRKLLLALLVLLAAVLLVSNLTFISAAYWISRQSVAPQAMHTLGELFATEELSSRALSSPEAASELLRPGRLCSAARSSDLRPRRQQPCAAAAG